MVEVNNVMTFLGYGLMDRFARSSKDMMSFKGCSGAELAGRACLQVESRPVIRNVERNRFAVVCRWRREAAVSFCAERFSSVSGQNDFSNLRSALCGARLFDVLPLLFPIAGAFS